MKRRGLTLLELLVVVGVSVILVVSIAAAYDAGIQFQQRVPQQDAELRRITQFEDRLRALIEAAFLTVDESDVTSNFQAIATSGNLAAPDTLVFTTLGIPPRSVYIDSSDEFEALNTKFGPQGGLAEVSISMVPVGDAPVQDALFLRVQRPADGDPSQGGFESVLIDNVESFTFEFFDGIQWVTEWDTMTGQRRLPAAVRFTYRFIDDDVDHVLTYRLRLSDVTPDNPLQEVIGE